MTTKQAVRILRCVAATVVAALLLAIYCLGETPRQAVQPEPLPPHPRTDVKNRPATEPGVHELTPADLEAFLDGFVPYALKNGDIPGLTISVVKNGQVLLKKGYGYADVKAKRPMNPDTSLVRVGSTSKLFTWTAVMQLVEHGKIDLDRDINDYLDFKIRSPFSKPITMRNLMTHRAGFEEGLKSVLMTDPKSLISTEQYLKDNQRPVLYPAGEVPAYSNYGAALAGYIVQRVSGEPFDTYVERHIFAPLGMTRSSFRQPVPEPLRANLAEGYMSSSEPPRPFELIITAPAGSMSTTADDMTRFMIAYLQFGQFDGKQLLKPETVHLMWQPGVQPIDDLNVMVLGFFEENRNGRQIRGHGGDTIVFHTSMDLFTDEGVGIFFSFNGRGVNDAVYAARQGLFDAFADRYFPSLASSQSSSVSAVTDAARHANLISGRYESSRRIETAFLGVLYLLNQTSITANADGTINVPTFPSEQPKPYREVAPLVWAEVDGQNRVALSGEGAKRTVYTNEDPSSVLQPVPWWRSGAWNMTLFVVSIVILLITAISWPVSAFLRRKYRQAPGGSRKELLVRRVLLVAALADLLYLAAWIPALAPILSNHLERYNNGFDPYLRTLQIAGLVVIAAALAGVWALFQERKSWYSTVWRVLTVVALIDIVWIGLVAKLISLNLNY